MILNLIKVPIRWLLSWLTSPQAARVVGEPLFRLKGMRRKDARMVLSQVKRVLVVRLDEIGDVVLTTPFLRELRRNLPDAWITLVVKPQVYNLMELCPYVNEVLTYDWQVSRYLGPLQRHWRALRVATRHLWKHRFDLAILPRWDVDYYHGTFLVYLSGAPWRVGYSENVNAAKKHLNRRFDRLLTHVLLDNSDLKHEVERNLDIIRFLGGRVQDNRLELWLGEADEVFAEEVLKKHGIKPDDLLVGLAPGAGAAKRLWPIARFAELGSWLRNTYGARLLVVGGPAEEMLGEELERILGTCVLNVVGQTTLRQTAGLLKRCRLFVGNDAGPMHMAAAVGVPIVEISCHPEAGSPWSVNSPLRFGPWGDGHMVIQPKEPAPPCTDECVADYPHCILGITVERVMQAVAKQLQQVRTLRVAKSKQER